MMLLTGTACTDVLVEIEGQGLTAENTTCCAVQSDGLPYIVNGTPTRKDFGGGAMDE